MAARSGVGCPPRSDASDSANPDWLRHPAGHELHPEAATSMPANVNVTTTMCLVFIVFRRTRREDGSLHLSCGTGQALRYVVVVSSGQASSIEGRPGRRCWCRNRSLSSRPAVSRWLPNRGIRTTAQFTNAGYPGAPAALCGGGGRRAVAVEYASLVGAGHSRGAVGVEGDGPPPLVHGN